MSVEIHRRTFDAAMHPKGSPGRARLNENALTSEYMTSRPWLVRRRATMSDGTPNPVQEWHTWIYKTRAAALAKAEALRLEGRAE